jgi:hypothetical protein
MKYVHMLERGEYTYNLCAASYLEYSCSICIEKKCEG